MDITEPSSTEVSKRPSLTTRVATDLVQDGHRSEADDVAVVVKTVLGSHFGVGAPLILEPILVGIGMFTGSTGF